MATVEPFRGNYYDPARIPLSDVITPPYDVISREEGRNFCAQSPYNFAHVILPRENGNYADVAGRIGKWIESGVLKRDAEPHYYVYEQIFQWEGTKHARRSLLAAVELSEFSEGIIRPHELTHSGPQSDRLRILRETQCNFSPIFSVVRDPDGTLGGIFEETVFSPPLVKGETPDGTLHTVWRVKTERNAAVATFFDDKPLYIVDGHHRYSSALQHAKDVGALKNASAPASRMFFAVCNAFDPALLVFPTHRLVNHVVLDVTAKERLESLFSTQPISRGELARLLESTASQPAFVMCFQNEMMICRPRETDEMAAEWGESVGKLSVAWSDRVFLPEVCGIGDVDRAKRVSYSRDIDAVLSGLGGTDLAVFLPAIEVSGILDVADEKKFMPQKSTYFYPKLAAGMLFRSLT